MATLKEKQENMDKFYPEAKKFFANVIVVGPLFKRAKSVADYLNRRKDETNHCVIASTL